MLAWLKKSDFNLRCRRRKFLVELFSIIIAPERIETNGTRHMERETFNRQVKERGDFETREDNWRKMKKEIDRESAPAKRRRSSLCARCKRERAILSHKLSKIIALELILQSMVVVKIKLRTRTSAGCEVPWNGNGKLIAMTSVKKN